MPGKANDIIISTSINHVVVDMSDCYTWSFPEFLPFCRDLYCFSNFKDFQNLVPA
jgi:hypothetical protein